MFLPDLQLSKLVQKTTFVLPPDDDETRRRAGADVPRWVETWRGRTEIKDDPCQ